MIFGDKPFTTRNMDSNQVFTEMSTQQPGNEDVDNSQEIIKHGLRQQQEESQDDEAVCSNHHARIAEACAHNKVEYGHQETGNQNDGALSSTSNLDSAKDLVESASSTIQRAQKRERSPGNEDSNDDDETKRHEKEEAIGRLENSEARANTEDSSQVNTVTCPFPRLRITARPRLYRRHFGRNSSCSSISSVSSNGRPQDVASSSSSPTWIPDDSNSSLDNSLVTTRILNAMRGPVDSDDTWSRLDSDDSDSDDEEMEDIDDKNEEEKKYHRCLSKEVPKHKWSVTKAVLNRQLGMHTRQQEAELFRQRCYGSLHSVKRLELMYKLEEHDGCVNTISFNQSGSRLVSGSDDTKIIVWDWANNKSILSYKSGHTSNIFQAKYLPLTGDNHIVSSARDGQVRLAVLSSTGECKGTRRLAYSRRSVSKLSILPETPHVFLSASEDARVMAIDVRCNEQSTLVTVTDASKRIGLFSVDAHPLNSHEFCVSGKDYYIRTYDNRKIDVNGVPMKKFCPSHIRGTSTYTYVTCALYNHDGSEILGSYNDESLYLFDARHSDGADFVHKYEGHRNCSTVKNCNFFGPNSEYIMSGSDCGNIFFWDKNTEAIVQFMRGDENGVVNALVGHPQCPILATSGMDYDVKIWLPSYEKDPQMKDLNRVVSKNLRGRKNFQLYRENPSNGPSLNEMLSDSDDTNYVNYGVNILLETEEPLRLGARFPLNDGGHSSASSDSDSDDHPLRCSPS